MGDFGEDFEEDPKENLRYFEKNLSENLIKIAGGSKGESIGIQVGF